MPLSSWQCALAAGSDVEEPPKKKLKQQEVLPLLATATKAQLDDCVAAFSYGTGIPLHISRCDPKVELSNCDLYFSSALS